MQHCDAYVYLAHERHVLLDNDECVLALEAIDDLGGLEGFRLGHAGGGFIEQNHFWILRDQEAQLEPLGLAVAEIGGQPAGLLRQTDQVENTIDILFSLLVETKAQIGQYPGIAATRDFEIAAD